MKSVILRIMLSLLFLVVFNVVFFLICGTENPTSVWISYGFIHAFYLTILLFLPMVSTKGSASFHLESTQYALAVPYFLLELFAGIACIVWAPDTITWPLIIQTVLWFLFIAHILINAMANDSTSKSLQKRSYANAFQHNLRDSLKSLQIWVKEPEMRLLLDDIYQTLISTPTQRTADTDVLDTEMLAAINNLRNLLMNGDNEQAKQGALVLKKIAEERKITKKYSNH